MLHRRIRLYLKSPQLSGRCPDDKLQQLPGSKAWHAALNGALWKSRQQARAALSLQAVNMVEVMLKDTRSLIAERPDDAAQLHGWPSLLSGHAHRGVEELRGVLEKRLGLVPRTPTGLPQNNEGQKEISEFLLDLNAISSHVSTIAVQAGKQIEDQFDRERTHDLHIPVPDERAVGGKRYARTVLLPRAPWEGVRHPRTGKIDVTASVNTERYWMSIGYPELGEVQLSLKPLNYPDSYIQDRRKDLHDLYDQTGVMARDGVNAEWVLQEWTKCHVFGNHAGARFVEVASTHPEHLIVKEHLQWSRDYETQLRELITQGSRESNLAYNAAVSKLRTQWLGIAKKNSRLLAAWNLTRRTMQDVAKAVAKAYGRVTPDVLKLKPPPKGLVFIDHMQDGKRVVRRVKPRDKKSWLSDADHKLIGLLAAFDSATQFKSGKLSSALELVVGLGSAMARSEHDSAGLDEMPGWNQASVEDKAGIAAEFGREVGRCRARCETELRATIEKAVTAANAAKAMPQTVPPQERRRAPKKPPAPPAPDYANDPKYIDQAGGAMTYNIPKANLSKAAKKPPGEPGFLRCFRDGRKVYYLRSDLQKLERSRASRRR